MEVPIPMRSPYSTNKRHWNKIKKNIFKKHVLGRVLRGWECESWMWEGGGRREVGANLWGVTTSDKEATHSIKGAQGIAFTAEIFNTAFSEIAFAGSWRGTSNLLQPKRL